MYVLCWMQYAPHWFLTTSENTCGPRLSNSSMISALAVSSRFSKACCPEVVSTGAYARSDKFYLDNERTCFMTGKLGPPAMQRAINADGAAFSPRASDRWNGYLQSKDRGCRWRPRELHDLRKKNEKMLRGNRRHTYLAPDVRGMLVDERQCRLTTQ
jgi:hypothetical protein